MRAQEALMLTPDSEVAVERVAAAIGSPDSRDRALILSSTSVMFRT